MASDAVLVLGGRHLVQLLVKKGVGKIRVVDKLMPSMAFLAPDAASAFKDAAVEFKQADLSPRQTGVDKAFDGCSFKYVFNLTFDAVKFGEGDEVYQQLVVDVSSRHALVSESIKANLIGGSSGARVDVFAYLKLQDVRGENNKAAAAPAKREQVERALRRLGVAAQDYVIASGTTPEPPACNASQGYRPFVDKAPTPGQGKQTKANRDSFAAQVTTKKLCYDLIVRREERQGWRYDYVLLARPDLTWWKPVAPWCLWLNSHLPDGAPTKGPMRYDRSGGVQLKPVVGFSAWDHALVVPRAHATRFFHEPYVAYYGCRAPFGPGQMVESWMHTHGHMDELVDSDTFLPVTLTRSQSAGTVHLQGNCNTNGRLRITASVVDRQSMCNALFATNPSNADRKESGVARARRDELVSRA